MTPDARRPIPRGDGVLRVELVVLPLALLAPAAVAALLVLQPRPTGEWRAIAFAAVLLLSLTFSALPLARRAERR